MDKTVLYTKTYSKDLDRLKVSIESIKNNNVDNIPYYISVPKSELELFKNNIDVNYVNIIADEDIFDISQQTWKTQQTVKSNFWRLNLCENYVMLDSDSYFIKPFKYSDFMYDDTTPYTVLHEQKDLFDWTSRFGKEILGFDPYQSYCDERLKIMEVFGRQGKIFDFGPGPVIWSSKVWKSLNEIYLQPNSLNFSNLIDFCSSEFTWYGEWLLYNKTIDIIPIEPIFKFMHFKSQYEYFKQLGYTEEHFKQNYFGIVMQSNWNSPFKF